MKLFNFDEYDIRQFILMTILFIVSAIILVVSVKEGIK